MGNKQTSILVAKQKKESQIVATTDVNSKKRKKLFVLNTIINNIEI